MTEEENKAIETLQYLCSDDCINKDIIKIIVNLIEKLKKENEEYKLLNANIEKANRIIEGKEEYISKDKIREKLEILENQKENYKEQPLIYMLLKNQYKELLEEE